MLFFIDLYHLYAFSSIYPIDMLFHRSIKFVYFFLLVYTIFILFFPIYAIFIPQLWSFAGRCYFNFFLADVCNFYVGCFFFISSTYLWMSESEFDLARRARGSAYFLLGRTDNLCLAAELSRRSPTTPTSNSGSILSFLQFVFVVVVYSVEFFYCNTNHRRVFFFQLKHGSLAFG